MSNQRKHRQLCREELRKAQTLALYIHVPFCIQKCDYCDFYSEPLIDKNINSGNEFQGELKEIIEQQGVVARFLEALEKEIDIYGQLVGKSSLESIYFGGGTPTLLEPEQVAFLLKKITSTFNVEPPIRQQAGIEISMEANPITLTAKKIKGYRQAGVNRLSLGVQSFSETELELLGRLHSAGEAKRVASLVKNIFENFSLDLMFALPGQTVDCWESNLQTALSLLPPHISLYNLQLESGTRLAKKVARGQLEMVSEAEDAAMYKLARRLLTEHDYHHYEISSFARSQKYSRHNKVYWQYRPFLGLGPAAHSFTGKNRFQNHASLTKYINNLLVEESLPVEKQVYLERKDLISEVMIMGLRLQEGISRKDFVDRFSVALDHFYACQIKKWCRLGLLEDDGQRIYLTRKGQLLANRVFAEFLL